MIIKGIKIQNEGKEILIQRMEKFIYDTTNVNAKIICANKINDNTCVIKMEKYDDKIEILKNKHKLKNL